MISRQGAQLIALLMTAIARWRCHLLRDVARTPAEAGVQVVRKQPRRFQARPSPGTCVYCSGQQRNLSSTRLRPAFSNSISSLLPSIASIVP